MSELIYLSIGGFLGAICRYALSRQIQGTNGFPLGTFVVNLLGAFLLGLLVGIQISGHYYHLLGIGFMGAFTTFSTFMLESEQLRKAGKDHFFYGYIVSSFILGLGLLFCGLMIGHDI